ncbi:peptidoglycan-recognition protein 1-like [Macrosteles quadrilineatus]|uniref:peptidoglycan-recognition protein 1-like n=1 Tax=Macrosteles quadrilineatus TaxID=74068 RepID=UPI0023E29363|nr:peptidoglycan-recognition protein 1-like [Macrosteles quadrilineatus]
MVDRDKLYHLRLREKEEGGPSLDIVTREEWGAQPCTALRPRETPPRDVIIPMDHVTFTHTSTEPCYDREECAQVLRRIQNDQLATVELHDMTFNFMIGGDGAVYEGRGWYKEPHRPLLYEYLENRGIEVAYIGEYEDVPPPPEMLRAAFDFLLYGMKIKLIKPTHKCIHLA